MAARSSDLSSARFDELEARDRRRLVVRSVLVSVCIVVLLVAAYYALPWDGGRATDVAIRISVGLSLLVLLSVVSVRSVMRSPYPWLRAVESLLLVVGLAVVSFASVYVVLSSQDASSFSEQLGKTDGLYFSLTTATTIGYGDISPRTEAARIVVMIQMITNVLVLGVAARVIINAARRRADVR
ncbi:MAG TPA: potassium channel family protein [Ilumatobacter sp.]|nr:potassium channel family protein [Ilumatobacter sp.]